MIARKLLSLFAQRGAAESWSSIDPRDPNLAKIFGIDKKTKSGVAVNYTVSMGYPAFMRGVDILSNGVKKIPMHVYDVQESGRSIIRSHPAERLLNRKPHPMITIDRFKQLLTHYAIVHGNGLAYIVRDNRGTPVELVPLLPQKSGIVNMRHGDIADSFDDGGELFYFTKIGAETRKIPASDMFHVMGISPDGLWGLSRVELFRESIGLGLAAREHGSRLFGQGVSAPGAIKVKRGLDDEAYERLRKSLLQAGEGLGKAHRFMVLEEGMDIQELTMSNEDAQFLQTREFEIREIANIVGIQAAKLGDRKEQSYNSLEMSNQEHKDDDLMPWLCAWKHQADDKLLTEEEKESGTIETDFEDEYLEWVPFADRVEGAVKLFHGGLSKRNEGRRRVGLPPSDDENADEFLRPANINLDSDPNAVSVVTPNEAAASAVDDLRPKWEALVEESTAGVLKRLKKQATGKAKKGASEFLSWLDGLETEQGPEVIREHVSQEVAVFKSQLNEIAESVAADGLLAAVEQACSITTEGATA